MMIRRLSLLSFVVFALSCSASPGSNFNPNDTRGFVLEIIGPSTFSLMYSQTANLTVRYTYNDAARTPITHTPLEVLMRGSAADSQIAARSITTNTSGEATVRVTSGTTNASFQVVVKPTSAAAGNAVTFQVSVSDTQEGTIAVEIVYPGRAMFDEYIPYLFQGQPCAGGPTSLPMPALQIGAPVLSRFDRGAFLNVAPGAEYTVMVVAMLGGVPAGFGCTVGSVVTPRTETLVRVDIMDWSPPLNFTGTYDLSNNFNWAGVLPPSVQTGVEVLAELYDDNSIDGNDVTMDWGQDPGAFVIDLAMRTTCAWECLPGEGSYSACSGINHGWGDLRHLYQQNFTSWSGAEARFFGGCGAWEVAARTGQNLVNNAIGTYVPGWITAFAASASDLAAAITNSRIKSLLVLDPPDEFGNIPFNHRLMIMEVSIRDLSGMRVPFMFPLADVGVMTLATTGSATASGTELRIPNHTFTLNLGDLVAYIYVNAVLPAFGFTSTAEMLASWIDCVAVSQQLFMVSSLLSEMQYLDACNAGITSAGAAIDTNLSGLISASALFTINGTVQGRNLATGGIPQDLGSLPPGVDDPGIWMGSWDEMGMSDTITGTFIGVRR